jgi:hypothetical protein
MYIINITSGELEQEIIIFKTVILSLSLLVVFGASASVPSFGGDLVLALIIFTGNR